MPPIRQRQKPELCSQGELRKSRAGKAHGPFRGPKTSLRSDRFVSRPDDRRLCAAEKTKSDGRIRKDAGRPPAAETEKSAKARRRTGKTTDAFEKRCLLEPPGTL